MDLESAAKYWWVQEFTNNDDAFVTSSSYLYKKRDGSPTPKGQKTQQQTTGQKEAQQQTAARESSNGKNTGSGTKSGAVNTGDNSKPSVWLLLIVCSAFIIRRTLWRSVERNRDK